MQDMDALAALRLQLEWGADDALEFLPVDRRLEPASVTPIKPPTGASKTTSAAPPPMQAAAHAQALADQAQTVEALRESVAGFEHCGLRSTASHTVFCVGDPASKLVLVADAPDADDDRAGTPFAGPAGALLDKILASIGLTRMDVMIAFVVPWRPPGSRPLTKTELETCLPFLGRLLQLVAPDHVVVLGGVAAKAVLESDDTLRRLRGPWRDIPGLISPFTAKALVSHHPATLLVTPACKREAWMDWLSLRERLDDAARATQLNEPSNTVFDPKV